MKKQLQGEEDIRLLVRSFYTKVLADEMLSPFFVYALKNNWDHHLQVMDRFWSNIIFFTGEYTGNPFEVHHTMHQFKPLDKEKFDRWLYLFTSTVDELFTGEKATLVKKRAYAIAQVMQLKILKA